MVATAVLRWACDQHVNCLDCLNKTSTFRVELWDKHHAIEYFTQHRIRSTSIITIPTWSFPASPCSSPGSPFGPLRRDDSTSGHRYSAVFTYAASHYLRTSSYSFQSLRSPLCMYRRSNELRGSGFWKMAYWMVTKRSMPARGCTSRVSRYEAG